ncbi:MAG: SurA N-terminal domain-containing protein [Bacteroidota bacterium]
MAIINTIRNYSGLAIFFIAISIFAFIAADLLGPGGTAWGGNAPMVGEINGIKIPYDEFNANVEEIEQNYIVSRPGQPIDDQTRRSFREQAWNNLITKYAFQEQFDELSVQVPSRELIDMVQGDSLFIHPFVRQQFTNPQTNTFDKSALIQYLQSLKQQPAQQRLLWENFEQAIAENRLRTKYDELLSLSAYVTEAEAERQYQNQSAKASVKFLYIPFTSIPDSSIIPTITEAQLREQLNKNPDKYKAEGKMSNTT